MNYLNKIIELSNKYEDFVLDIRRKIHKNPELSFKEYKTSELIIEELKKMNLEYKTGFAGTGIICNLKGKELGKTILYSLT